MRIPVTGDMLYDFVLVVILIVVGMGLALKADKWWGYILVVVAGFWALQLVRPIMGM
ncbi:MAG TPA: hypothetical protein PLS90_16940 [Candidatus Sumerlaeota bacterium]|nr:hypothetical protein [Candidatus Sumerlaeota bacterium]HOR28337.1 hypothetical protein [Candidatus Sumerlaeota bacterium]HPK04133.1 hypothetical protein [Candidatus Sumerlaeota bacterium]